MPEIPTVEIGAIGAALIAGVVSLLGLIISKEQKTSEFRQAWVDALRNDLSNYLTQINAICDGVSVKYESIEKKVEILGPLYKELNKATFNIALRVNPEEPLSKQLLSCMKRLHSLTGNHSTIAPDKIRPIESEMIIASQQLLKAEWKRVKTGERTFVFAKFAALAVVLVSVILALSQMALGLSGSPEKMTERGTQPKAVIASSAEARSKADTLTRPPTSDKMSAPISTQGEGASE